MKRTMPQMTGVDQLKVKARRIERWPAATRRGSSGLIDLSYDISDQKVVRTMELIDDEARQARVEPALFPARSHTVWFVLTVYNRPEVLKRYLKQMKHLSETETGFKLCVTGFVGDPSGDLWSFVQQSGFPSERLKVQELPPPFRKSMGLQNCISALGDDDIVFVSDVDIQFPMDIVSRVRRYVFKA